MYILESFGVVERRGEEGGFSVDFDFDFDFFFYLILIHL